ncbi:MAG: ribosome biogenesis GTPase Der [Bacteroidia bacterium]|nr:ribosome biogenesis GTPase Der [Bacteroidia bacterium]MCZ2277256.1 ribosome biogenesis GTPase Der [Bacteroidia bacterium]
MPTIVAIVGRPNTGKSTLFNRLTESRDAIVDPTSGVTRDRHYGKAEWNGKNFSVIDTGGYVYKKEDDFADEIRQQVELAVDEADVILFMTDVTTGLTDLDEEMAKLLRKSGKPVFLVVNKVDNLKRSYDTSEFYKLGFGEIFPISSASGSGTGELLDALIELIKEEPEETPIPRLAIIGQPNTGKSSLLNTLIGKKRSIVTSVAGTTRDAIDVRYTAYGFDFLLIDTAGLRKRTKVKEDLEFYSVMRTIQAIESADICLLMIDATQGITSQDINIFFLAEKNKKGIVVIVNKWDLLSGDEKNTKHFEKILKERIAPFTDVPVIFTSVTQKLRIHKTLETAVRVYANRKQKISTSQLNKVLLPLIAATPPPSIKGKTISIKYITQLTGRYPKFAFFANLPQYIKEPYRRFIENKMREHFNFSGVPISLIFKSKSSEPLD